ncbi:membrane protein insertase YidC [Hirschia baltica]|uniref:Membrane protein insertase YidC n=1 Tax=Hirschia baltica (strain ATCC 49814 / DSM 5838 / IFAM 1418) TaxID=582402 RepID=C6XQ56_HIRBI|nr:membrane protein insertase YidC [Hirschia baltica]ACT58573.1 60 kDa inner membrane insertion protein [Hirschia baltica ATCC 49814]
MQQQPQDQKSFMIGIGLVLCVMALSQFFIWGPQQKAQEQARLEAQAQAAIAAPSVSSGSVDTTASAAPVDRAEILTDTSNGGRIDFDASSVDGSISLKGARLDDLSMKRHFETIEKTEEVHLLSPQGSKGAYYAALGWRGDADRLPGVSTLWKQTAGSTLTPSTPITLGYETTQLSFSRKIEVDDNYMFTYTDTVTNNSSETLSIRPFGFMRQFGMPDDWKPFYILHEGAVGMAGNKLKLQKYKNLDKGKALAYTSQGGWIGLTQKYWMTAFIPAQTENVAVQSKVVMDGLRPTYVASIEGTDRAIEPGQTASYSQRIFAGAKRVEVLDAYQQGATGQEAIPRFTDAVDWGNFWFFTKPFFWLLSHFNSWFGNFGLAILALTVIVKLAFFPIQNKAYASMAKMRKLMPQMEEIKKKWADDKERQQKETMELYKREKANPFSGCLPLIPQMFVFYGLYKTLFVTLEMRHEPFFGWIKDLSAPDPTSFLNLFGALPFDPSSLPLIGALSIGVLPILYGFTMWLLQNLNAPPPDPTQRMMMQFLPIVFTFIFAGFAAGLVIYWTWSNILSIAQQYYIMRKNGVETQFDKFIKAKFGKSEEPAE